jgi:predicted DNA-binding transcriptional regulator AlpA
MNQGIPPDLFVRRVISEQQAAAVCSLSVATMRRIRQAGTGPTAIMLSARRVGYRIEALDRWLGAREGKAAA